MKSPSSQRASADGVQHHAVVLGGSAVANASASALLVAAGFELAQGSAPGVAVVLTGGTAADQIRALRGARDTYPLARVLAVMHNDVPNSMMRRALLSGADGIILDGDLERALGATARAVLAGQLAVPSALTRQLAPRPLSHREKQIMSLVAAGCTNREIADRLFLAETTVKTHLSSAFRKVDARSRAEAVARLQNPETGFGLGILDLAPPGGLAPAS